MPSQNPPRRHHRSPPAAESFPPSMCLHQSPSPASLQRVCGVIPSIQHAISSKRSLVCSRTLPAALSLHSRSLRPFLLRDVLLFHKLAFCILARACSHSPLHLRALVQLGSLQWCLSEAELQRLRSSGGVGLGGGAGASALKDQEEKQVRCRSIISVVMSPGTGPAAAAFESLCQPHPEKPAPTLLWRLPNDRPYSALTPRPSIPSLFGFVQQQHGMSRPSLPSPAQAVIALHPRAPVTVGCLSWMSHSSMCALVRSLQNGSC